MNYDSSYVTADFESPLKTFVEKSKKKSEEQKDYFVAWDKYYNEGAIEK